MSVSSRLVRVTSVRRLIRADYLDLYSCLLELISTFRIAKFNRTVKEKCRVYRVVDRKGNFMRYEIYQELFINDDKLSEFCWPFDNPDEWGGGLNKVILIRR